MKYVNLGRSGLKVSRLCLGCMSYGEPERLPQPWSLDEKASRPLIRQALEAGINFFDTANIYSGGSSEESRCNRNTTCFTGKKSARCCPCVKTRALG
jgi:aryl-alcohol dehydrogenase-like predicted oxidoreductase